MHLKQVENMPFESNVMVQIIVYINVLTFLEREDWTSLEEPSLMSSGNHHDGIDVVI